MKEKHLELLHRKIAKVLLRSFSNAIICYNRWEKQQLEGQIKELKKTNDELHRQGKRRGSLTRQASTEKDEGSTGGQDSRAPGAAGSSDDITKVKAEKSELETKVKDVSMWPRTK